MYSPKEYQTWQAEAARLLTKVPAPEAPTPYVVEVAVRCFMTKPKTTKLPHPKPDVDNYAKGVLDVITKDGRFWIDDSQVQQLLVSKAWIEGEPRIDVEIREL
jgi:Holliday junction resolvase RusA-like endonuclease